ncbi:NAD(P)/FAD-dependent oxidoreductase [Bowmanella denitrificans]|uniref:NAD(P)/FAD-dependent oxidoreductase n=1 Tax=Bowmanella denitrificans TaxID=366582 RepID=UPI000C9B58AF|nr:FAD-dependent oxidoreductase [Bowmanella denitrificans]
MHTQHFYDPLRDKDPGQGQAYPNSYWASQVEPVPLHPQGGDQNTDVAIIGAGYTGLSCAWHLAKQHDIKATVLDANQIGWGCSGRNGGFVLNGTGRLSFSQMEQKWGERTAKAIYAEYRQGIDTVQSLIEQGNIACDQSHGGYLKIAHKAHAVEQLQQQAELLSARYQDPVRFIPAQQLQAEFLHSPQAHGALHFPYSFAVQPLKLALGYARLAEQAGAQVLTGSPVQGIARDNGKLLLTTPNGTLRANKLVIATNGYTANRFFTAVDGRHFPVLSSIIVTEPLSDAQLAASGLKSGLMAMDTRTLKYYYRLLPDNRILFGGRGAIQGKHANHPVYQARLLNALTDTLPALSGIKVAYFWSGWVSVSLDDYPRICQADDQGQVFYAMGYCGSGLSFASQAGKRLAQRVAGDTSLPDLPFMQSPLPHFPLAACRRLGLWAFYHLGRLRDSI